MRSPPSYGRRVAQTFGLTIPVVFSAVLLLITAPALVQAVETVNALPALATLDNTNANLQAPAAIIIPAISVTVVPVLGIDARTAPANAILLSAITARTGVEVLKLPLYTPSTGSSQEMAAYNANTGPECAETKFLPATLTYVPPGGLPVAIS